MGFTERIFSRIYIYMQDEDLIMCGLLNNRVCIYIFARGSWGETTEKEAGRRKLSGAWNGQREMCEMICCQTAWHTVQNMETKMWLVC